MCTDNFLAQQKTGLQKGTIDLQASLNKTLTPVLKAIAALNEVGPAGCCRAASAY